MEQFKKGALDQSSGHRMGFQPLILMHGCALSVMLLTLLWYCPLHVTIVVPFKEGTVPGL